MRTWSDSPFPTVVGLADVPEGRVLGQENGESRIVYEVEGRPGWIAKIYRKPLPDAAAATLRRLIHLPTLMSQPDMAVVDGSISWPVARIMDGTAVVGVVAAKAPDRFFVRLKTLSGAESDPTPLVLDWLMTTGDKGARRGIRTVDPAVRLWAMARLLAVGVLFARHDIVYADWSYTNAFWEQGTGEVFVIDMDTCAFTAREWIESPGWEDPLFPGTARRPLTVHSDSYKLAVVTVRCLTGMRRDPMEAHTELVREIGRNAFTAALERALTAGDPAARPGPAELVAALRTMAGLDPADPGAAGGGASDAGAASSPSGSSNNVTGHIKVGPVQPAPPAAAPQPPGRAAANGSGPLTTNVTGSVDLRGRRRKPPPARPPAGPPQPAPAADPSWAVPAAPPAAPRAEPVAPPVPAAAPSVARHTTAPTASAAPVGSRLVRPPARRERGPLATAALVVLVILGALVVIGLL